MKLCSLCGQAGRGAPVAPGQLLAGGERVAQRHARHALREQPAQVALQRQPREAGHHGAVRQRRQPVALLQLRGRGRSVRSTGQWFSAGRAERGGCGFIKGGSSFARGFHFDTEVGMGACRNQGGKHSREAPRQSCVHLESYRP